jgi:hypothetical protein
MVARFLCSRAALVAAALILAGVSTAFAQPLIDPQRVEFDPSPDHNAVNEIGTALLNSYRLDIYIAGQSAIYMSANLGKPTPEGDGKIRVAFLPLLPAPLVPGIVYESRVSGIGPGGSGSSPLTNTFTLDLLCASSVSPTSLSPSSDAISGAVAVTAGSWCAWNAISNDTWIAVTSGASGSGQGSVGYSVAANPTTVARTGTLTIARQTVTVTQAAFASKLSSPVDGAANVDTAWPFTWTSITSAPANRLTVGTTPGGADLVDTGEMQGTAYAASNLPGGQTLYARIWTKLTANTWSYTDASFATAARASFFYPTHNAIAVDPTLPFTWTAVPGALAYTLNVGTSLGAKNLVDTGEIPSTSYVAASLPLGQTLYARIWTKFATRWDLADIAFTTGGYATFVYPTNNLSNVNTKQPFRWTPAPTSLGYRVTIGSSAGASNLADSGEIPGPSFVAPALPPNQWLFARIATHFAAGWQWQDIRFATSRGAYLLTPAAGAVVGVACSAIGWTPVADARAYTLNLGTTAGAKDVLDTGATPYTTLTPPTLPANRQIFARIWTKFASDWTYSDVQFSTGLATLTSPANSASGVKTSGSFQWSAVPGAAAYRLYVGDTAGASNRINSGEVTQTSYPMTGLPAPSQLYAQLWTKTNGCWVAAPVVTFKTAGSKK